MALAYSYFRQEIYEEAATLYAELAEAALTSSLMSKEPPVIESIRLHSGTEENKDALRKFRGEDEEDFQITEYQAPRGNAAAMYKLGLLYYYGLRGLRHDYAKAFHWFSKAVEKGETRSMELRGEIYAGGARVDRNYTEAYKWLTLAAKQQHYSAYNGLGYLYVKGYGVEKKNLTKARELFALAAENKEPGGHYNLDVLYLKGIGVKRDVIGACNLFLHAVNAGQPKLFIRWRSCSRKALALREIAEARLPMVASDRAPSIKRQDSFEMKLSDLQKIDNPLHQQSSKNSDPESPISLLLTSDPKNEGSHPKTFSGLLLYLIVFMLMSGQRSSRQTLHHFGCLLSSVLQNIFMLC